ncbi:Copine family protein [Aphelenchoides avenae]|nr:Copine family protein [Aphelenchus avenae]
MEDKLIGRFTTTFFQLLSGHAANKYLLRGGENKKEHASMELLKIESVENIPSFIGLLRSGLQLHFTVAIDFTAKNGGQNDPNALHYVHPHQRSIYMEALSSICSAITKFDKLNRLSLVGFGAKVSPSFEMSNLFALNGNIENPYVRGAEEALQIYRRMSMSVLPYAPTEYSGVIHHVVKHAKASVRSVGHLHFVLIVLTNGSLKNPRDTQDTIIQASELPVSVVFVALGNEHHPVCSGDRSRILRLLEPTLKSSTNVPLSREVVAFVEHSEGGDIVGLTK